MIIYTMKSYRIYYAKMIRYKNKVLNKKKYSYGKFDKNKQIYKSNITS